MVALLEHLREISRYHRRMSMHWVILAVAGAAVIAAFGIKSADPGDGPDPRSPKRKDKVVLTNEQWKKRLTPEQFRILRSQGTEAAFCSPLHDIKKTGSYSCVGCGLELFKSNAKFHSGTGWPSFFRPASKDATWTREDNAYGMRRVEVLCARCDGHLGHVFDDGYGTPSGKRFCINGEVLKFKEAKEE